MRFSTVSILLAMVVAIANMPTDVFQICAWNVGTLKIEPWRRKLTAAIATRFTAFTLFLRTWFRASGGLPAVAAIACIIAITLLTAPHIHASHILTAHVLVGLKGFRQRDSDLKAQIATAKKDRAAIGELAMKENRAMTAEEKEKFLAAAAPIEALEAQLAENAELLQAAEDANEAERAFDGVAANPDGTAAASAAAGSGVHTGRDLTVEGIVKQRGFFGRALQSVRHLAIKQGTDDDIKNVRMMAGPKFSAGPTGLNTDVPSEGGFLVAPDRSSTIIQRAYETGVILSRVRKLPIGPNSNGMKLPAIDETSRANGSRYGGIASGWLGQGNTLTAGKPKFREMDMKLRKVGAFVYGTDEQIADSIALESWINTYLPLELQFRTEDAFINGDGSNQPLGAINSGAAITVTRGTSGHITADDFRSMYSKMWSPLRGSANTAFLIDQSSEPDLDLLTIPIGTAGVLDPSFKAAGTTPGQKYPTYKGVPIITVEYMAQLGTSGDLAMVAFDEYLTIDKGAVEQAVSLHVAFLTDEAVFRFMYRVDGQLSWNKTLTLKSGLAVSSVIVLS